METGDRKVGPATLRIRQTNALPLRMRERTRELCAFHVPAAEQNKGYGTTLMHKVCREADKANMVLVLWPQPFGDDIALSKGQLAKWYEERFGFMAIQPEPLLMARMPGAIPRILSLNPISEAIYKEKTGE